MKMEAAYKEIEISCPICQGTKKIKIPNEVFSQKKFGSIKVQIPPGVVCPEHQFIVFVDQKGIVRGYEKIDILMDASIETDKKVTGELFLSDFISIYGLYGVFSLLHACLFNYPVYIVKEDSSDEMSTQLWTLFEKMIPKDFCNKDSLVYLEKTDYDKIKMKHKNALLIDSHKNILQTPWERKLKFEESIIKKALEIIDEEEQLLLIKQDISNFLNEVDATVRILDDESVKEVFKSELINQLIKDLKTPKIDKNRLNIIKEFIHQRYSPKLAKKIKSKLQGFLNLL